MHNVASYEKQSSPLSLSHLLPKLLQAAKTLIIAHRLRLHRVKWRRKMEIGNEISQKIRVKDNKYFMQYTKNRMECF